MRKTILVLGAVMAVLMFAMVGAGVALAETVFSTSTPTTAEDCKNGGYAKYGFKNQGQCIKAVNHATPADTTAPETTITAGPAQESQSEMESVTFEFTSSEPNSTFECQAQSHTFGSAVKGENLDLWHPCTSPMTYSPLRDDTITFRVRAIDAAGNVDPTPTERLFYARRLGPSVQITSGPEDRSTVNTNSVTFEWTTDGVTPFDSRCSLRDPNGVWIEYFSPCSSPKTYQLTEDGDYFFGVFVEDATGNHNGLGQSFLVDLHPPDTTITRNDSPNPVSNLYDVQYTLDSTEPPLAVQCRVYLQDEVPGDWVNRCDPAVSPGAITTSQADGTYIFEARAIDPAGTVDPTPASDTIVLQQPSTSN